MIPISKHNKDTCRVCAGPLFKGSSLFYQNMPCAAQGFPNADDVDRDKGTDLLVRQCSQCGLVQLENDPVPYYKEVIRAAGYSAEMKGFRLSQFHRWAKRHNLIGRDVLEVGCGKGEYLSLLVQVGMRAVGLEYAGDSVTHARARGLTVYNGFLERSDESPLHSALFDGFVCLNFLEHWPHPNESLSTLRRHLRDGAIGLVEVPNFDMIVKQGLYSEFIADHLFYFTKETLAFALQNNGLEVLGIESVWHDYSLSATVRARAPLDLGFFHSFRENVSRELHSFVDRFPQGRVAVWGAGHQALAVLALADLGSRIQYVVDSAVFKQGKYTPATHLRIVPPAQLDSDPVDAVIVMAASYSDEVVRELRGNTRRRVSIAVLRDHGLEVIR